jgi:hypothetical protein
MWYLDWPRQISCSNWEQKKFHCKYKKVVTTCKLDVNLRYYSETSLNQFSLNTARFFKSLLNNSLEKKSHKTGHPSKLTVFFGPKAVGFREISLYILYQFFYFILIGRRLLILLIGMQCLRLPHNSICITIQTSWSDTYHDTWKTLVTKWTTAPCCYNVYFLLKIWSIIFCHCIES